MKPRRKELRSNATLAEKILWNQIKKSYLGHKFRRQHGIEGYILDFYCPEKRLCIELDGKYHDESDQKEYDHEREKYLQSTGIHILRFTNDEVITKIGQVVTEIAKALQDNPHNYYKDKIV